METFSADVPPVRELKFRDQSSIGVVIADFVHIDNANSIITLQGDGNGQTEATVVLTLGGSTTPLPAGEYRCQQVIASDVAGHSKTFTPDTHPLLADKSFRYEYPSGQPGDTEGPELIG